MKKCKGFKKLEGKCNNILEQNEYWCTRCNAIRVKYIINRFKNILENDDRKRNVY